MIKLPAGFVDVTATPRQLKAGDRILAGSMFSTTKGQVTRVTSKALSYAVAEDSPHGKAGAAVTLVLPLELMCVVKMPAC